MLELFVKWTKLKIRLHVSDRDIRFREREIWWCSLGKNIGYEQDGKNEMFERPILILKKFNNDIFWGLPFTSQEKTGKYYYQCLYKGKKFIAILSQLRLVSSKRLLRRIRTLSKSNFTEVKKCIKNFL